MNGKLTPSDIATDIRKGSRGLTIRRLRENLQDSEFYYDRNREVVFKFQDKLWEIHGSKVPEKGPVVIEFREAEDDEHVRENLRLRGIH